MFAECLFIKHFAFVSDVLLLLLLWYLKCFHNGFCTALTQQYQLLSQFYGKTIVLTFEMFGQCFLTSNGKTFLISMYFFSLKISIKLIIYLDNYFSILLIKML